MTLLEPYWRDTVALPRFEAVREDLKVDVVIAGGGLTGITTAYLLSKEGLIVALLEADRLLNGTTAHTTAKITAQHGLIYDEFIRHFGKDIAKLYYEANAQAMHFMKQIMSDLQIDCDFSAQDAYLYATTEDSARKLEQEYNAYRKLGINGELTEAIPFAIKTTGALKMKNQAQFHPLKYLARLVQGILDGGGLIFENTVCVNVDEDGQQTAALTRDGYRVTGRRVIACTHFPFYEGMGLYSARLHAERSYVLACKTKKPFPGGIYLNVDQPGRSLRAVTDAEESLVLIGGEGHKAGQGKDTTEHYRALEAFGHDVLGLEAVMYRWSTQDLATLDKIPYVGAITSSRRAILVATGYRKWGMTNGTAAARLLKDLVLEKENPFEQLYAPSRFYADPSLKRFFMENANVVKHLVKGKWELPDRRVSDLSNDQGAVVLVNGERKGAYKDKEGRLHLVDTTCTHIGCEVNWNSGDRTWDCPCHGSRFSYTGEIIEGPAEKPLQRTHFDMLDNLTREESGY